MPATGLIILGRIRHVAYDISHFALWFCWGSLGLVWVVGARVEARRPSPPQQQNGYDLASRAGAILAIAIVLTPGSLWRSLTISAPLLRLIGVVLLIAGEAATVWARIALGAMWSSAVVAKAGHELRTDGPYRVVRHPIYSGILAMLTASALTQGLGRWLAIGLTVSGVLFAKLRAEDRLLAREFPDEFPCYRKRVPAVLPRLSTHTRTAGWRD